jgi:hypothetical protein
VESSAESKPLSEEHPILCDLASWERAVPGIPKTLVFSFARQFFDLARGLSDSSLACQLPH